MRVTFVSQGSALGGAERSLLDLMIAVRQARPEVAISLIAGAEGDLSDRALSSGVEVALVPLHASLGTLGDSTVQEGGLRRLPGLVLRSFGGAVRIRRQVSTMATHLRRLAPDIVHTNDAKSHLLGALAAPSGAPVIWHLRDFIGSRALLRRVLRWSPRRPAACAAISRAVARDARTVLPWARVSVLLNAVDLDHFSPAPGDGAWLDRMAGVPPAQDNVVRVGLVATYAWWKGHETFIRAAADLLRRDTGSPARFYVVGGPIYRTSGSQCTTAQLRALAAQVGIGERIGFTGFQHDTAGVYRSLDVVVHASTRPEPFGRTIAEGMACGRAVIASPDGGAGELFTDGHDAVAVKPGSPASLARAVEQLVADASFRAGLGRQARTTALERFSRARLGREALALYDQLLSGPDQRSDGAHDARAKQAIQ